jgi:hypothetical protein
MRYHIKRLGIFLIALALIAGMAGCTYNPPSQNLEIRDWYDLDDVRNNLTASYVLMNDLDSVTPGYGELASPTANGGKGWQPIGTEDHFFTGSFDGQGYEPRDVFINRPDENYIGLFGGADEGGHIENTGVVDAYVIGGNGTSGLVGVNGGTLANSYSAGNVTGQLWVGGLVGANGGNVSESYSLDSVSGNSSVGGLIGDNKWTVSNCYAAGSVVGNNDTGGLVGKGSYNDVTNSFWDTETSGQATSDGGTGKNTTEMKDITTFSGVGWNITAVASSSTRDPAYIWNIVDDATYPFLSWQPV